MHGSTKTFVTDKNVTLYKALFMSIASFGESNGKMVLVKSQTKMTTRGSVAELEIPKRVLVAFSRDLSISRLDGRTSVWTGRKLG